MFMSMNQENKKEICCELCWFIRPGDLLKSGFCENPHCSCHAKSKDICSCGEVRPDRGYHKCARHRSESKEGIFSLFKEAREEAQQDMLNVTIKDWVDKVEKEERDRILKEIERMKFEKLEVYGDGKYGWNNALSTLEDFINQKDK